MDDAELILNTAYDEGQRPAKPDPGRDAGHADTALFFGCGDLEIARARLERRGVVVQPLVTRDYGMRQLWLTDPDGFRLCFQAPAI